MTEPRNDYGFPLFTGAPALPRAWLHPAQPTKLERAQAYAAEVRARKFPAPGRITPKEM